MPDDSPPVVWKDREAIVTFPDYVDVSNVGRHREQLLSVINRGATVLIVDMTDTASCDHSAVDALARAYQRATVSGTQLRLVVTAPVVRRVISIEGLDRLVSVYPSLEAAIAAGIPGTGGPLRRIPRTDGKAFRGAASVHSRGAITPAVLWHLIDSLGDGLALVGTSGEIVLVNRRCTKMFGYTREELIGWPVDSLVPLDLRAAHQGYRAAYDHDPQARQMGGRARLVALRKDGASLPVEISLSPLPTATGDYVLAVIRDATEAPRLDDLAGLARSAVAKQPDRIQELLDRVVRHLSQVGLSLQDTADLPSAVAHERITEALARLDDTIKEIRDCVYTSRDEEPDS
jgi:anti-anti-sigma factor